MELKNKRILLFAPSFFGYDNVIKDKLEELGASVDLYNERPSNNVFIKAIIRIYKKILFFYIENYFGKIAKKNSEKKYDYVLVIKGEVFNRNIVEKLKSHFPNAKFILYLWDSIRNYKDIRLCIHLFNNTLTFDLKDSIDIPSLKFRPLFYIDDYSQCNTIKKCKQKYDLLFVGTVHSDRWIFLKYIMDQAIQHNLNIYYYLYVQSPLIFLVRKLFDRRFRSIPLKDIKFRPISKDDVLYLTSCSKAVLDIQHPRQTGLTMRTIEVFGAKRKLITTNDKIANYDIYSKSNILLVDRINPKLDSSFLISEFVPHSDKLYFKYSMQGWLEDIFN